MFISFEGTYAHDLLAEFAGVVLELFDYYGGYFKEIDFGDKGGLMVGFFGVPQSFENNEQRALEFSLDFAAKMNETPVHPDFKYKIGISAGQAFTGIIGGEERCQLAVVGNRVNMAARLMSKAEWSEIWVDEVLAENRQFLFKLKGKFLYKGLENYTSTYVLTGKREDTFQANFSRALVGRQQELEKLLRFSAPLISSRKAGVIFIFGEAGAGKSRLVFEFRQKMLQSEAVNWFFIQPDQIFPKPFHGFARFFKKYFQSDSAAQSAPDKEFFDKKLDNLAAELRHCDHPEAGATLKELERTRSMLAALVGLKTSDSLFEQLDAKGRYENMIVAIVNFFVAESLLRPFVLELEDAHSLDGSSREVFHQLLRRAEQLPMLFLLLSRYHDDGARPEIFDPAFLQNIPCAEIHLSMLAPAHVKIIAESILGSPITAEFTALLQRITNGNPFYIEQILEYFIENDLLKIEAEGWTAKHKEVKISNSIQSILMARIDRLSGQVKETVKAAAVIGREFEVEVLSEVMAQADEHTVASPESVRQQVKTAEQEQIWKAVNELRYIFHHSLLREAVYDMQLRTRLRRLHLLVAQAIEKIYADNLEEHYFDLVFHYKQADVTEKTIEYLEKSARYAQHNFQNQQAIDLYQQLADLLEKQKDEPFLIRILFRKSGVHELIGQWDACEKILKKTLRLSEKADDIQNTGRAKNELGRLYLLKGDYQNGRTFLEQAATAFEKANDTVGLNKVFGNLGLLFFRQGQYEQAKKFLATSIEGNRATRIKTDPQLVSTLALAHMNLGKYTDGIQSILPELEISRSHNDKRSMATLLTNMGIVYIDKGDYDEALKCFEEGLQLSEELGNRLLISIGLGSIGSIWQEKGNYEKAMELFRRDLVISEDLGDRQGIAIAHGLIGELLAIKGEFSEAKFHLKKSLEICRDIGYKKGIAKAVNNLGDVYFLQKKYEKALASYQEAIEVTRAINNKLVLGKSLTEQAATFLELKDQAAARELLSEALLIADELGNPDLLFQAKIMLAKVAGAHGEKESVKEILENLLKQNLTLFQQATVYYNLAAHFPENEFYKKQALGAYRKTYADTPQFLFKKRIEELSGDV
ncbi:MAG TPA: tetratricopeptide repeat protein [Saprospiraceae bacterium]|nr:tetratricopeptide repeat protein [Saprospiraceae bacterium]